MCGYFFYLFSAHLQRHQKTCISLSITKLLLPAFLIEEKYGGNYITVRRNCQLFFEY